MSNGPNKSKRQLEIGTINAHSELELVEHIRRLSRSERQITMSKDEDGVWQISYPMRLKRHDLTKRPNAPSRGDDPDRA